MNKELYLKNSLKVDSLFDQYINLFNNPFPKVNKTTLEKLGESWPRAIKVLCFRVWNALFEHLYFLILLLQKKLQMCEKETITHIQKQRFVTSCYMAKTDFSCPEHNLTFASSWWPFVFLFFSSSLYFSLSFLRCFRWHFHFHVCSWELHEY